jgi:hypothetical protein
MAYHPHTRIVHMATPLHKEAGIAYSVQLLATGWTTEG